MEKLILADNQAIFRAGAAKALTVQGNFRIVAQCIERDRLMHAVRTLRMSVILFASSLEPDKAALIQDARAADSRLIVIAENHETLRTYAARGFDGVIFRDVSSTGLVECVQRVAAGGVYLQQKSGRSLEDEADTVGARVRDRLTPKEMKIVGLIVEGYRNKEIAALLGTTEQVIKNYLRIVYDKTGVSARLELALFTIHHRILAEATARINDGSRLTATSA